jgi:hypothetical protein
MDPSKETAFTAVIDFFCSFLTEYDNGLARLILLGPFDVLSSTVEKNHPVEDIFC